MVLLNLFKKSHLSQNEVVFLSHCRPKRTRCLKCHKFPLPVWNKCVLVYLASNEDIVSVLFVIGGNLSAWLSCLEM